MNKPLICTTILMSAALVAGAAVDAGKSIMDIYNDPESDFGIERKADNSPLTKAKLPKSFQKYPASWGIIITQITASSPIHSAITLA